jgi:choline dehydrogenase-like flavoprotein
MSQQPSASFSLSSPVDFVIVGSGAAGGVLAKELSTRGLSVVVLEQGPRLTPQEFEHDEFKYFFQNGISSTAPVTWRQNAKQVARQGAGGVLYAKIVGGSSVHFTANFWRFRPIDFIEASKVGTIEGTGLADWN